MTASVKASRSITVARVWQAISDERKLADKSVVPAREAERADAMGLRLSLDGRGMLSLDRDALQHRRFAWLYDDLMSQRLRRCFAVISAMEALSNAISFSEILERAKEKEHRADRTSP